MKLCLMFCLCCQQIANKNAKKTDNRANQESIDTSSSSAFGSPPPPITVKAVVHREKSASEIPAQTRRSSRAAQNPNSNSKQQTQNVRKLPNKSSTTETRNEDAASKTVTSSTRSSSRNSTIETSNKSPKRGDPPKGNDKQKKNNDVATPSRKLLTPAEKVKKSTATANSDNSHKYKTRRAAVDEYMQNNVITRRKSLVVGNVSRSNSIETITSPRRLNTDKTNDQQKSVTTNRKSSNETPVKKAKTKTTANASSASKKVDNTQTVKRSTRNRNAPKK